MPLRHRAELSIAVVVQADSFLFPKLAGNPAAIGTARVSWDEFIAATRHRACPVPFTPFGAVPFGQSVWQRPRRPWR